METHEKLSGFQKLFFIKISSAFNSVLHEFCKVPSYTLNMSFHFLYLLLSVVFIMEKACVGVHIYISVCRHISRVV